MRVVDLYAGVGGWSVGFKLAGFEIAKSYEWWGPAADTHRANSRSDVEVGDIRTLDLKSLPENVDVVVGSPPCTQFSYSNRGGSGDLADGLVDIERFLGVVDRCKPAAWAFENVPRVKSVLERELTSGGALEKYRHLFEDAEIEIFDIGNFGVPQRRKRCIAGNFDFELLRSYCTVTSNPTLGDVVFGLKNGADPIFKSEDRYEITDNDPEQPLNWEEERFNRDMKTAHPVYNGMPFPDPLERSSRTVTATCTRVSRESLIIKDDRLGGYRRLSVRERASLQTFPVNFQFLGKSHAQKLKMIGNAIPPVFTYLIAEAIKGTRPEALVLPEAIDANSRISPSRGIQTKPDISGRVYPEARRFRFSVPNLRFKSGTRFELSNIDGPDQWNVAFYFGDSKRIHKRIFSISDLEQASVGLSEEFTNHLFDAQKRLKATVNLSELKSLQATWSHREDGLHPFCLLDELGQFVSSELTSGAWRSVDDDILRVFVCNLVFSGEQSGDFAAKKISKYCHSITVGAAVAAFMNKQLGNVYRREETLVR